MCFRNMQNKTKPQYKNNSTKINILSNTKKAINY